MVHKWGIFCTGSLGGRQFGVKKSVFLHQKLPLGENGAQMRHFLHRELRRGKMVHKWGIFCTGRWIAQEVVGVVFV